MDPETKGGGKPGQKLDDDEDRKNPAYIPRKGLFFEHDVRGHAQEEERYRPHAVTHSLCHPPAFSWVMLRELVHILSCQWEV